MELINNTISINRLFICLAPQAGGSPLIDEAITKEHQEPFRTGKGILIRLPFTGSKPTIGLNIGWWASR